MKHFKLVTIPEKTQNILDKKTCDLCGIEIEHQRFSAEDVKIIHTTGNAFPEGGGGQEISFDLCGKCFDEKLMPWLVSNGAKPEIKEWSF